MDHCADCGYEYGSLPRAELPAALREGAAAIAAVVRSLPPAALRRRPSQGVWSPLEYACHVADVLAIQRGRVEQAQFEERPAFASMERDRRAADDRYNEQDPADVAARLVAAGDDLARFLDSLDPAGWARTGVYQWPVEAVRDVDWIARHTVHEERHHLADIERQLAPQP